MAADDLAHDIRTVRFTPVRLREGYDMGEVDDLLDEIVAALGAGTPIVPLIENARFTPVRLREGYDMADVDDFLAGVVARAGRDIGAVDEADDDEVPPDAAPRAHAQRPEPARAVYPEVIKENRGWWSRLFGPRRR